ncbi:hypothetical protein V5799_013056 [Amblyomma americanum]|uniref:Uncharacterized protein n=1 Tax=Amblyomma americanum TaxID=6943 RepID=A0AAQ4E6Z0_AMBAM
MTPPSEKPPRTVQAGVTCLVRGPSGVASSRSPSSISAAVSSPRVTFLRSQRAPRWTLLAPGAFGPSPHGAQWTNRAHWRATWAPSPIPW